jgi:hypothetical protein
MCALRKWRQSVDSLYKKLCVVLTGHCRAYKQTEGVRRAPTVYRSGCVVTHALA